MVTITEKTPIEVRLPASIWLAGLSAFIVTVGTVTLAWANISHTQESVNRRLDASEQNQLAITQTLNETVRALSELRGEFHATRNGNK